MLRRVRHKHALEDFRDVVDMNRQAVVIRIGKLRDFAARGSHDALHVVNGTKDFIRTRNVCRPHAGDRHAEFVTIVLGLPLVENLMDGILVVAMLEICLVYRPLTEVFLQPIDGERTGVYHPFRAGEPCRFEEIVHPVDVQLQRHV